MASATTPAVLAPDHTGGRKGVVPAATPDPVERRHLHGRISLAYLIFKALCLLIAAFFLLVLGILGAFIYLIN